MSDPYALPVCIAQCSVTETDIVRILDKRQLIHPDVLDTSAEVNSRHRHRVGTGLGTGAQMAHLADLGWHGSFLGIVSLQRYE